MATAIDIATLAKQCSRMDAGRRMREAVSMGDVADGGNGAVAVRCARLAALPRIAHGFFTRKGGTSRGIFRGLNAGMGSGDERPVVVANRALALAALGAGNAFLATVRQTHSADVVTVSEPWRDGERPAADAMVTARPDIVLGVLTADCGPILLADSAAGIVGAAHAGWKGAIGGVLENTVAAMEALGARRDDVVATLGPTIGPQNYEVGPEFVARFIAASPENEAFFSDAGRSGHAMFDLPRYILARLHKAGIDARWTGECTYADAAHFYSYRRATHRGEDSYGRQLSAIMIRT